MSFDYKVGSYLCFHMDEKRGKMPTFLSIKLQGEGFESISYMQTKVEIYA
jgi:hypothetical protein